jgi:hypothetical protein
VQIALKPASKALGLHGVFICGQGLKDLIADSALKGMQVNAPGAMLTSIIAALHFGQAGRSIAANGTTGDMRASLELAGAQHSLSPMGADAGR